MPVEISCQIDNFDGLTAEILRTASPEKLAAANAKASRSLTENLKDWYGSKGGAYWSKPGPTHGPGRKASKWWEGLVNWDPLESTDTGGGAYFGGKKYGLAQKVTGGTIRPTNARALTIPLVPEAHGRRVSDYVAEIGDLFRPKGKNYLAETLQGGGIRAVYSLRQSVTQEPFPDALPTDKWISDSYETDFFQELLKDSE